MSVSPPPTSAGPLPSDIKRAEDFRRDKGSMDEPSRPRSAVSEDESERERERTGQGQGSGVVFFDVEKENPWTE